jgi:hypothetical protein
LRGFSAAFGAFECDEEAFHEVRKVLQKDWFALTGLGDIFWFKPGPSARALTLRAFSP